MSGRVIATATENQKQENEDYAELMTKDSASKEVIMLTKKLEKINVVTAMMDMMLKDLDEGKTIAIATEKDAQADYEAFMKKSAEKRTKRPLIDPCGASWSSSPSRP